jgi:tight adherence protein B
VPADSAAPWYQTRSTLFIALVAIGIGLAMLLGTAFVSLSRDRSQRSVRRRLSFFSLTGRDAPQRERAETVLGNSAVAQSAVELAGRMVAKRNLESELSRRLEAAGVSLKPAEWLILHLGVAILLPLVLALATGNVVLVLAGLAVGVLGPFGYLSVKESRRRSAFLAQLPDMLSLLAGSLSAGYSLPQGIDAVVSEGQEPIATEFRRAVLEARLGVPIEDALASVAERMSRADFGWVVMAIRVQHEVGGNLGEILRTVAETLREREYLRRQVSVLSAEGRLSAYILGALPVLLGLYLVTVRGDYIRPLYTDPLGIVMLVALAVLFVIGFFWLRRTVRVEV